MRLRNDEDSTNFEEIRRVLLYTPKTFSIHPTKVRVNGKHSSTLVHDGSVIYHYPFYCFKP